MDGQRVIELLCPFEKLRALYLMKIYRIIPGLSVTDPKMY